MVDEENSAEATSFEWVEELPDRAKRGGTGRAVDPAWAAIAQTLQDNSGKYAKVATHDRKDDEPEGRPANRASNHAARIRAGKSKAFLPAKHFEAEARPLRDGEGNPTGSYGVFVRHIGEQPEAEVVETEQADES